ncbi:hypothetical protein E1301_Tti010100 [Triplophysa tibetana]|uniref:Uncharacterized protein n=1 Tax=Triplophysa tibetana TaxID=1572043 RepID=A0A5A9P0D0_9TELE|nr:hypothetical protein E1301_Tti010100 [Triplophysa tibetana]
MSHGFNNNRKYFVITLYKILHNVEMFVQNVTVWCLTGSVETQQNWLEMRFNLTSLNAPLDAFIQNYTNRLEKFCKMQKCMQGRPTLHWRCEGNWAAISYAEVSRANLLHVHRAVSGRIAEERYVSPVLKRLPPRAEGLTTKCRFEEVLSLLRVLGMRTGVRYERLVSFTLFNVSGEYQEALKALFRQSSGWKSKTLFGNGLTENNVAGGLFSVWLSLIEERAQPDR